MEAYIPDADDRKQVITEFFATSGQQFLPILELLMEAKEQLHAFTHAVGVAAIEGLLELSATQVAGEPHPGKATAPTQSAAGPVRRHGLHRAEERSATGTAHDGRGPRRGRLDAEVP